MRSTPLRKKAGEVRQGGRFCRDHADEVPAKEKVEFETILVLPLYAGFVF